MGLPIFIGLTTAFDGATRRKVAAVSTLVSFVVLVFFICLGQIILTALGVSLHSFEVAGGLILFVFAILHRSTMESAEALITPPRESGSACALPRPSTPCASHSS